MTSIVAIVIIMGVTCAWCMGPLVHARYSIMGMYMLGVHSAMGKSACWEELIAMFFLILQERTNFFKAIHELK